MEDYAIIIGINDYTPPQRRGLRTLRGAVNDANRFEEWVSKATGGNVPPNNIKKIISTSDPLKPLQDEIDDAFLEIEAMIRTNGATARRLYFYFAGHGLGTLDDTNNTAFCLANWSEYKRQAALSSREYMDTIKQYGYFEEIFFVADCCRNTKINIKPKSPTFDVIAPADTAGKTNMFVAYATQYQDQSYEIESIETEMRGAFTTVLLDALEGAASKNGVIGADDLRDYLKIETPKIALQKGYKQIPDISHTYVQNTPLLTVVTVKANINITFSTSRNNIIELLNGNLDVIATYDPAKSKSYSIPLANGLYQLRDTANDDTENFKVSPSQQIIDVNF